MLDFFLTCLLFYLTLVAIPALAVSYLVLSVGHRLWILFISLRYPDIEFLKTVTVRTLLDTHRNQGILSVLLCVKGKAQPDAVRRHLDEVVKRRNKAGKLAFPRLRHCLVAKCGNYGWKRGSFDLDNNVIISPLTDKRRAVTEFNIQDHVSDIVSKYLPPGIPPWQLIIIPSSEDQHYILCKLHHVLLNEGLNIGDLLPLIPPTRQISGHFVSKSPLVEVLKKPTAIHNLKERLTEDVCNAWNEFVSNYDPLECPKLLKTNPSLFQFYAMVIVSIISTIKEVQKGIMNVNNNWTSRFRFAWRTLERETRKRSVSPTTFLKSILVSMDPRNALSIFWFCTKNSVLLPVNIFSLFTREILAIYMCVTRNYCSYSNTIVGSCYNYFPLIYSSIKEVFYYIMILFQAPRNILTDILLQKESFQTITLCGRKSVAWSEPVKLETIKRAGRNAGVSETEIALAAISSCLSKYFVQTKHVIPDDLPISIRNINSNYILATGLNIKPEDAISGILCLNLPILDPEKDTTCLENLGEVKEKFRGALDTQGLSHLLTLLQTKFQLLTKFLPSSILRVYLRYLSRKYAISVAEVTSRYPSVTQRTLWGQEVSSVVYFRPPQANSSVSLVVHEYADHVKLSVACDSQLAPHHFTLARVFPEYIEELATAATLDT